MQDSVETGSDDNACAAWPALEAAAPSRRHGTPLGDTADQEKLFQALPGTDGDAGERRVCPVHGKVRFPAHELVEAPQEAAAAD
jgi:hypothetical protein